MTGFDDLPQGQRLDLARITSEPIFTETAKLLVATGMAGQDATAFIKQIKAAPSEKAAMSIIGTEFEVRRDEIQRRYGGKAAKVRKRTYSQFDTCRDAVMALLGCDEFDVSESAPTPEAARRLKDQLIRELGLAATRIAKQL